MAYLHEMRLNDAIKRLYLLGKSGRKKDQTTLDGDTAIAGAANNYAEIAQIRQKEAVMKNAIANAKQAQEKKQFSDDVDYIKGMSPKSPVKSERYAVSRGEIAPPSAIPAPMQSPVRPVDSAIHNDEQNRMVEDMPIGGLYTPSGLQKADKEANLNAQDRMRLKALIGSGMQLSQPTPYQPDWAVERAP